MNKWLVASYKVSELKNLETNLKNQNFSYYLPKIIIHKTNCKIKEEALFPGYIFIDVNNKEYQSLNFTKGIKKIIKFGNNISYIDNSEIEDVKKFERSCQKFPLQRKIKIGQSVEIKEGSLKGNLVNICSLPAKDRVDIFINILGFKRKVNIELKNISV